jgi:hypothetical protein
MTANRQFLGKYRGKVVNNLDPLRIGRLQVSVPDEGFGIIGNWATPCLPWGGIQTGMVAIPPVGAGVWVEFERGDPDFPIWVGCYWGNAGELPVLAQAMPPGSGSLVAQAVTQGALVISDLPPPLGAVALHAGGNFIAVHPTGIFLQTAGGASIAMTGPTVTVNAGALVVT